MLPTCGSFLVSGLRATYSRLMSDIGAPELLILLAVLVLLFGASKLPDLARGTGQALRIFKTETRGLLDDDAEATTPRQSEEPLDAGGSSAGQVPDHTELPDTGRH